MGDKTRLVLILMAIVVLISVAHSESEDSQYYDGVVETITTKEKPMIANSIILLFDASNSMSNVSSSTGNATSNMGSNRKIDNAKAAVKTFISRLDPITDEVALIVFYDCGNIVIEQPFTTNQSAISSKVNIIKPTGHTPLSAAIDYATDYMNQSTVGSKKKIIMFTDFEETCPYYKAIHKGGDIELSIIGFDIRKGSNQEAKLQEFAKKVGGAYLSAEDASNSTALVKGLQQAYGIADINPQIDPSWWIRKGNNLYDQGKYDEAIQAYDKAIEINPQFPDAWMHKGYAFDRQGKFGEAIKSIHKAIEIDPKYA